MRRGVLSSQQFRFHLIDAEVGHSCTDGRLALNFQLFSLFCLRLAIVGGLARRFRLFSYRLLKIILLGPRLLHLA